MLVFYQKCWWDASLICIYISGMLAAATCYKHEFFMIRHFEEKSPTFHIFIPSKRCRSNPTLKHLWEEYISTDTFLYKHIFSWDSNLKKVFVNFELLVGIWNYLSAWLDAEGTIGKELKREPHTCSGRGYSTIASPLPGTGGEQEELFICICIFCAGSYIWWSWH
jgi:hypothetical protein